MKGILLAGGRATRLYPVTRAVSKHLLPVYDKPMFFYPLSTLIEAGIREVLIITNPRDRELFYDLVGNGAQLGMEIQYAVQPFALGIADALRIGRNFAQNQRIALILGDNIFTGLDSQQLKDTAAPDNALIFATQVPNPQEYGVVELDAGGVPLSLEEKPQIPRSNLAVPGLYYYPPDACELAQQLSPSSRGELEITHINQAYLASHRLKVRKLTGAWLDAGTFAGLFQAIAMAEKTPDAGCIELAAYRQGFLDASSLEKLIFHYKGTSYGAVLEEYYGM